MIVALAVNEIRGKTRLEGWLRPLLTRKLPCWQQGEIPFCGNVIIYAMRRP